MAAFSISTFTKLVALTHPLGEVFAVRGLFAVLLMGTAMVLTGDWRYWRSALGTPVLARSLLDAASSALYVAALVNLSMTDVSAVVLLSPVIVTTMAVVIYREKVICPALARSACRLCRGCCSSSGRHRPRSTHGQSSLSVLRLPARL